VSLSVNILKGDIHTLVTCMHGMQSSWCPTWTPKRVAHKGAGGLVYCTKHSPQHAHTPVAQL
jgi:hypothetical protein